MKAKILNAGLIISSLFGYLEWGDNSSFLFEVEAELILKLFSDPLSVLHPFTIIPMAGQILLLITLFQKKPSRLLSFLGIGSIGLLFLMIFLTGLLATNVKILLSVLPFLVLGILTILHHRKGNKNSDSGDNGVSDLDQPEQPSPG